MGTLTRPKHRGGTRLRLEAIADILYHTRVTERLERGAEAVRISVPLGAGDIHCRVLDHAARGVDPSELLIGEPRVVRATRGPTPRRECAMGLE